MRNLILLGLASLMAAGCTLKTRDIPTAPVPFASADYTVLGNTNAEACGTYILGIEFSRLFSGEFASYAVDAGLPLPLPSFWGNPEAREALYEALGRMPNATHLLAPRVHTEAEGILLAGQPFFGRRCATIDARGVQIGDGPVPNAK